MKNNNIRFIAIAIIAILITAIFPAVNADIAKKDLSKEENIVLKSSDSTFLMLKVCYLECLDNCDHDFPWDTNKEAEFLWKIKVIGGLDGDGEEEWKHYCDGGHRFLYESDLEKEKNNPYWWDITGLDEVPIVMELWDDDPNEDDMLDINGELNKHDVGDRESCRVRFFYYPETDEINFDKSGGKYVDLHGGSIEFHGHSDGGYDINSIMRIKIWTESDNLPPADPDKPSSKSTGDPGEVMYFTTSTIDPNADQVLYLFDWGDGTDSGWLGPYNSGEIVIANHTWTEEDTYKVKVKAKDDPFGEVSKWSEEKSVKIDDDDGIKKRSIILKLFSYFFHQKLKNVITK